MASSTTERVVVVASSADAVPGAVRSIRNRANRRGKRTDVEVVVGSEAVASAARTALATVELPAPVSVTTRVTGDAGAFVRDRGASGTVDRVFLAGVERDRLGDLDDLTVPVERLPTDPEPGRPLVRGRSVGGFLLTFLVSYGFYLLLGDPTDPFDLVTGAVTGGLVAVALSSVVVEPETSLRTVAPRALRATAFLPYLGFEILKANLGVAYVILHPDLPIDPRTIEYDPGADGRLERAVLANAVTLTPGTLTVAVDEDRFLVHALTPGTRSALERGNLARAVAWVFHGRDRA